MEKNEELFRSIADDLTTKQKSVEVTKMFGELGISVNGNALACLFNGDLALKLTGDDHAKALKLKGAKLFDPSAMNRPVKEWVLIPASQKKEWQPLADASLKYASTLKKK